MKTSDDGLPLAYQGPRAVYLCDYTGAKAGILANLEVTQRNPDPIFDLGEPGKFWLPPGPIRRTAKAKRLLLAGKWRKALLGKDKKEKTDLSGMFSNAWDTQAPFTLGGSPELESWGVHKLLLFPESYCHAYSVHQNSVYIEEVVFQALTAEEAMRSFADTPKVLHAIKRLNNGQVHTPVPPDGRDDFHVDV